MPQSRPYTDQDAQDAEPLDIADQLRAYVEREAPPLKPGNKPTATSIPSKRTHTPPPADDPAPKPTAHRRRSTTGLQRTKSSKLPLERVPRNDRIQNHVLPVSTSVASIIQTSRKLDMARNSIEWGYPPEEAYEAFSAPVTQGRLRRWCADVDGYLAVWYDRLPGADVEVLIEEGIRKGMALGMEVLTDL